MSKGGFLAFVTSVNEKYFPGHRCNPQALNILEMQDESKEFTDSDSDQEGITPKSREEVEEVVVSLFHTKNVKTIKVMKFKGEV
jgi:hypothetical protein